jgi:hypothetical protein
MVAFPSLDASSPPIQTRKISGEISSVRKRTRQISLLTNQPHPEAVQDGGMLITIFPMTIKKIHMKGEKLFYHYM